MNKGIFEGELCNRDGCTGIIEAYDKEGCCSCHISAPCSYCTTQTEYCPKCGWTAEDEQHSYIEDHYSDTTNEKPRVYKTSEQLYSELPNGQFGYIRIASGSHTITHIRGKYNGLSRKEIFRRFGCADRKSMARMKMYDEEEFELTYFND